LAVSTLHRSIALAWRAALWQALLNLAVTGGVRGQEVPPRDREVAPVVDSVAILTENVFSPAEAERHGIFRLANALRVTTQPWVVEREVLLRAGQPYDSALAEETERNLRLLQLFRDVRVDTVRVDSQLVMRVHARDAWSTQPILQLSFASDGTVTGRAGLTETNLLGTGNLAHIAYRKDVDRDGLELSTELRRIGGSQLNAGGRYYNLSDGNFGNWFFGDPWRSFVDTHSIQYGGDAAARQAIQYRVQSSARTDTTRYWVDNYAHWITAAFAARATPSHYTRFGLVGEIRKQKYVLVSDTSLMVPDTIRGYFGVYGEYRQSEFLITRYLNGFTAEDVDLSSSLSFGLNVAPSFFGYDSFGLGPALAMQAGAALGSGFVQGRLQANALFNAAGLDSGRVVVSMTVAQKPGRLHTTLLHARAGTLENPPPGGEFDLGFEFPPRSWEPHSFVGTRAVWGTLEHRWFALPEMFDLVGLGFVGFVDYGGAWYGNQSPRWGGAAGFGLRLGSSRSAGTDTGRLDIGYRFGSDLTGSRWVISFGTGWKFP
jgi:outer membrane protein assembly factor BamA